MDPRSSTETGFSCIVCIFVILFMTSRVRLRSEPEPYKMTKIVKIIFAGIILFITICVGIALLMSKTIIRWFRNTSNDDDNVKSDDERTNQTVKSDMGQVEEILEKPQNFYSLMVIVIILLLIIMFAHWKSLRNVLFKKM